MKTLIFCIAVLGLTSASALAEKKVKLANVPPAVQNTVKEETKNATFVGLAQETENGKTVYELETKVTGGGTRDLMIDSGGAVYLVEEETTLDKIPAAARAAIEKQAAGGKISKVETLTKGKTVTYEAVVKKGMKSKEIVVNPDGSTPAK
jgi:hypothetical protein